MASFDLGAALKKPVDPKQVDYSTGTFKDNVMAQAD